MAATDKKNAFFEHCKGKNLKQLETMLETLELIECEKYVITAVKLAIRQKTQNIRKYFREVK